MSSIPLSILLLGAPGSGKSTLCKQALAAEGSGLVALAPGLEELASYTRFTNDPLYKIAGFDDEEFYPQAGSNIATGYDRLLAWLRGVRAALVAAKEKGEPLPYKILVTDTFNQMSGLAVNKTFAKFGVDSPPPAMSPTGAAFWGYQKSLQEQLQRACRVIKGEGLHWIATCHIAEKEMKETSIANPSAVEGVKGTMGMVPAISGGFRDVMTGGFDLVLHTGVTMKAAVGDVPAKSVHFLQWMPSPKRPTKSRYGALAEGGKIAANWVSLREKIAAAVAAEAST